MHCHCGTNNRVPRWTFTDLCKPEVRPGAREESASPAWLATPAMNARDTTKVYIWRHETECGQHYIGSVTATTHQEKGIITLESNIYIEVVYNLSKDICYAAKLKRCKIRLWGQNNQILHKIRNWKILVVHVCTSINIS